MLGMANHTQPDGTGCRPSVRRLVAYTNFSESTIRDRLRKARKLGLLEVVRKASQHRATEYRMNIPKLSALRHQLIMDLEEETAIYRGLQGSSSRRSETAQTSSSRAQTSSSRGQTSSSRTRTSNEPITKPNTRPDGRPPKAEQDRLRKIAEETFRVSTGLEPPEPTNEKRRREAGELWWNPLRLIVEFSQWDDLKVKRLIEEAIFRMQESDLTISSPKSILNSARAIIGEKNTGRYKARRPSAQSDREFLEKLRTSA